MNLILFLFTSVLAIEQRPTPEFIIDFDVPALQRYDSVFQHFRADILEMENYFYSIIPISIKDFYARGDNLQIY
jgi:hypothetical protein